MSGNKYQGVRGPYRFISNSVYSKGPALSWKIDLIDWGLAGQPIYINMVTASPGMQSLKEQIRVLVYPFAVNHVFCLPGVLIFLLLVKSLCCLGNYSLMPSFKTFYNQ